MPRLSKAYRQSEVHQAVLEAVQSLGYSNPTSEQFRVVEAFVEGQDVFVPLPTGSGKSVCYACLPLVFDLLRSQEDHRSIVVVVAPLSALMQDQVASFQARGLTSSCVGVRLEEEASRDDDAVVRGIFSWCL